MKIIINRSELIQTLSDLALVIRDNSIRPAISGTELSVKDGTIVFTGTNLETTIKKTISGEIIEEGTAVFRISLILEYIKLLDQDEIMISIQDGKLFIHNAEFLILDHEEYPTLNFNPGEEILTLPGEKLVNLFDKVSYSASSSPENLAINCVRLILKEKKIQVLSTDSYRLTSFVMESEEDLDFHELSIPLDGVTTMTKLFRNSSNNLVFSIDGHYLRVSGEGVLFSTRIIELSFPDFQAIFENISSNKTIEMNLGDLRSAIRKVLTIARISQETKNGANFDFVGNKLKISVSSGKAKTVQKIDTIKEGDNFKASLNVKFIDDFLSHISKNVVVSATDSSSMFIFNESGNKDYTYILMPLALKD